MGSVARSGPWSWVQAHVLPPWRAGRASMHHDLSPGTRRPGPGALSIQMAEGPGQGRLGGGVGKKPQRSLCVSRTGSP